MDTQDSRLLTPSTGYTNITNILDLKLMDINSQTSPDTRWHIFGLVYDSQYREVIMPNNRARYDLIRDCLACSQLHTRPAFSDGMMYIKYKNFNSKSNVPYFTCLLAHGRSVK